MIDPNAPVVPEQDQSGSAGQFSDTSGTEDLADKPAPVQEIELQRASVHPVEPMPAATAPELGQGMPSVAYVTSRISEYNKKMERWRARDSQTAVLRIPAEESEKMVGCLRDLQRILNGYNRLHDVLLQQASMSAGGQISAREIYELQQSDIDFIDGFCGQAVAVNDANVVSLKGDDSGTLTPVEAVIAQHAAKGEFEELVQVWKQMPEAMAARMQLHSKILYGNALMTLRRGEEAAQVYRQLVDQMKVPDGQPADLLSLRKILADLYVASGKYQDAEAQYLEISKEYKEMSTIEEWAILQRSILERSDQGGAELKEYSDILKNYLGFNPAKDGYTVVWQADKFLQDYPYSPVASNVDVIRNTARERADKWSKNVLVEADELAGQKRYQDALGKLETVPATIVSPETQQQIVKKTGDLVLAEKLEGETLQLEKTQELDRRWNEGVRLMEGGQYDKAIEIFTPMLETEYSAKADKKIAEASLLAAEAERRNAADVFIRFTKAPDVESKKKLLIESRRRLQEILVRYPGVEITDKVIGNIKRVEKELKALDHGLMKQAGGGEGEDPKAGGAVVPASEAGVTGPGPVREQVTR